MPSSAPSADHNLIFCLLALQMDFVTNEPTHGYLRKPAAEPPAPAREKVRRPIAAMRSAGRNDPCPCGSGKKYKKCHGANV